MKLGVHDLAIFGGAPAFSESLYVGRPNIGDRARLFERLDAALDRRWLSNDGPLALELEQHLSTVLGVRHCIPVCNGTVGLEIAIRAADLHGEVIVPSWTFIATAHALQWQQITPVFCDVDRFTHTLDPRRVEELITPRTSGILGVHLWGQPCATDALQDIATRHGLKLLFDAAHAFGCSHQGRMIGGFGDAEVFSFHATKFFNSFEGGAIATNDDDLARRIRQMKNFGFAGTDDVAFVGTNGKMSEVAAAMALTNLESLVDFVDANRRNYETYLAELDGVRGLRMLRFDDRQELCNYQYIVLEVDEREAGLSRDELVELLQAEKVLARRYFHPACHAMEPYRTLFPAAGQALPQTERLARRVMALPTGTAVDALGVQRICELIRFAVDHATEIRHAWPAGGQRRAA